MLTLAHNNCCVVFLRVFLATTITVIVLLQLCCKAEQQTPCGGGGGWETDVFDDALLRLDGPCNIETHDVNDLSQQEFLSRYAYAEPVIIKNLDSNPQKCAREQLLREFGQVTVKLCSANTYSYTKLPVTLNDYVHSYLKPQRLNQLGNESFYLFGDLDPKDWDPLLANYLLPPLQLPDHQPTKAFGLAGAGSGVPFHFHGPGFGEVIYGRKRWFLYPPDEKPPFDPDNSTLQWLHSVYPTLIRERRKLLLECVLSPGQAIYFPDRWWHATLNLDTTVFVSTFLSPLQPYLPKERRV